MSSARLHTARLVETKIFGDLEIELASVRSAIAMGDAGAVRPLPMAYHRRRVAAAGRIVQILLRPDRCRACLRVMLRPARICLRN